MSGADQDLSSESVSYRETLRDPVAGRLWVAAAISALGDYVGLGALLLLAFERTGGQVIGAAGIFAVQALPAVLSGAIAGSWLDAMSRRTAMVSLQLVGAGALLLPVLIPGVAPVVAAAALVGAVRAGFGSVRSGVIAEAVEGERRASLLALLGISDQTSQVVGYLTGASVAVALGAAPALLADSATFVLAGVVVLTIPLPHGAPRPDRAALSEGLREIWGRPALRLLAPLVWLTGLLGSLPEVLAVGVTGGDSGWTPLLMAAGPAGQAATMAVVGRWRAIERVEVQLTHLAWLALALGIAALGQGPAWFLVGNLLIGSGVAWVLGPQTLFVRLADPARMAQVTGMMLAGLILAEGIGTVIFGALADAASVGAAYWTGGLVLLIAAVTAWLVGERTGTTA